MELQKGYTKIKALEAEVLIIGVDPMRAWDKVAQAWDKTIKEPLTLSILADEDRAVSKAYGVLGLPSTMHADRPGHTFIIVDRNGVIQWKKDVPDMSLLATSVILEQLQRLQTKAKVK